VGHKDTKCVFYFFTASVFYSDTNLASYSGNSRRNVRASSCKTPCYFRPIMTKIGTCSQISTELSIIKILKADINSCCLSYPSRWELHHRVADWLALQHRTRGVTGSCLNRNTAYGVSLSPAENNGAAHRIRSTPSLSPRLSV
jgi:hypothetical protein